MSHRSASSLQRERRSLSIGGEVEHEFREGVLMLNSDGVFVQRYFTVFDSKIVYAFRGKERKHEFSPLTIVEEPKLESKQHVFKIITNGERPFELAAMNSENKADWIKAIKEEVFKLISNILDDIEKEGLGPYPPIIDGTLLEEGSFASYVLRKQGSRVVPVFMYLQNGRLAIKKRAFDPTDLRSWRVTQKTVVDILESYAAPAFSLDKETLLVGNWAIQANWITVLKSSISKSTISDSTYEIDFAAPQIEEVPDPEAKQEESKSKTLKRFSFFDASSFRKTLGRKSKAKDDDKSKEKEVENNNENYGTMMVRDDVNGAGNEYYDVGTMVVNQSEDAGNDFYKTFAGSVRITGKVPWEDFSTFKEIEGVENDDSKFADMQLEYEEITDENAVDEPAPVSINEEDKSNLNSTGSSTSLNEKAEIGNEIVVPVSRNQRPRSASNAKKPNFMRIRLKAKSPEGPIKVYRGCIEDGDLFKSIIVTSEMKTNEVLMMILEKYEIDPLQNVDGTYVLVEEEVGEIEPGTERYRRILEPLESPLIAKLNWDHRSLQFAIAKREEFVNKLVDGVDFKVLCVDGTSTSLKFSDKLSATRVCEMLGGKLSLQKASYPLFSLWMATSKLELQLEPFQQIGVMAEDWKSLELRFAEGESSDPNGIQLHYRRWAFLSKTAERRCKDPAAIKLLYEQAKKALMDETCPYVGNDYEDLFILASLQCQLLFGDYNPELHTPNWIFKNTEDLRAIFPPSFFINYPFKKEEREKKLIQCYKRHAGHQKMITEMLYLQQIRQWPHYGSTFFHASLVMASSKEKKKGISFEDNRTKGILVRVGVNVEGIHIFDQAKNTLIISEELGNITICTDLRYPNSFMFECRKSFTKGTLERKKDKSLTLFCLFSPQVQLIQTFVTSSLHQQAEDARALKIMRNIQRKRSATDVQNFQRENFLKYSTQRHLSPTIKED